MIDRSYRTARLVTFIAAGWIVVVAMWGLVTGADHVEAPRFVVWLFLAGLAAQLILCFIAGKKRPI